MAKISAINIPVTVDPTGMDRGIAQAERKLRSGSERMQRAASSMSAARFAASRPRVLARSGSVPLVARSARSAAAVSSSARRWRRSTPPRRWRRH
jgi:hypothetical protein